MKQFIFGLVWLALCFATNSVLGADRVVIVPLGGAVGDAGVEDVVMDKTFSSRAGKGLTGIRFPALLKKTGQTTRWNLNDDAFYNRGIDTSPRWTYMQPNPGGGIIIFKPGYGYRDNNSGLIWLADASHSEPGIMNAINYCENLDTVQSIPNVYLVTDWRLPNIVELLSLVDYGQANPALPADHHFTGLVLGANYWSSTTNANATTLRARSKIT
jgi:Protein of unknown function (DUF1566)